MGRARAIAALAGLLVGGVAGTAAAQGEPPAPAPGTAPAPAPALAPAPSDLEQRLKQLEESNARMREELDRLTEEQASTGQRVDSLMPLTSRLTGYLDFGFFYAPMGNGSGIRADIGHRYFPEFAAIPDSWVFYGDPLSTAVNSRGEPAETDVSRAVVFDPVNSGGKSSFLVNALNLGLFAGIGESLTVTGSIDLVPRGRDVSVESPNQVFLGDYIDVKLAYAEYIAPVESFKLSLYAGKFDSVLGFEYRSRESPDRLGVTPSLICRYTCGSPLGLKARGQFLDDKVILNVAVTNGSHGTEGFPIHNETDTNQIKTAAGRLSTRLPVGTGLEIGVSGSFGAQDLQPDDSVYHWHYGADLHLDWHDIDLTGEYVQGKMQGKTEIGAAPCGIAQCLEYRGAYGQIGYRWLNWFMPYARVDWRDALHQSGESFVYISELMRVTGGLRFELGTSVIIKAEYLFNLEMGKAPQFPDDVFTSSMVVKY